MRMTAVAIAVGVLGIGAFMFASGAASSPVAVASSAEQTGNAEPEQDPYLEERTKGDPNAPITIYETADFACPVCKMFFDSVMPALESEYIETGKAKIVFVNFPIPQLHPNAPAAHEFAMCSARQDRFWPVHDLLYRHQQRWASMQQPEELFSQLVDSAGVDRAMLSECFDEGQMQMLIEAEARMAYDSGIQSTPSFVIEGILFRGAAPIEAFRQVLDSLTAARQ